jgi:hypothetical protein
MNWKIIFQLSVFGLIMAFGTISLIPEKVEPVFWVVIFIFCAWVIAKTCTGKYFLHGFLVSLVNCVWITAAHVIFRTSYLEHHPNAAAMAAKMPPEFLVHPRLAMMLTGPVFGAVSGIILGLFAYAASKIMKLSTLAGK